MPKSSWVASARPGCSTPTCYAASLLFFKAALRERFTEAADQQVCLPEDDINAFTLFVEFLGTSDFTNANFDLLLQAYPLADRLDVEPFRRALFEQAYACVQWYTPTPTQAAWVATHTMGGSTFRHLIVHTMAVRLLRGWVHSREKWEVLKPIHLDMLRAVG